MNNVQLAQEWRGVRPSLEEENNSSNDKLSSRESSFLGESASILEEAVFEHILQAQLVIYHVEKMGKQMRGKSRRDGGRMNKDSAKKTTCNFGRPPCREDGAKPGQTGGGTSDSMICQTKESEHHPQASGRPDLKG